MLRKADWASLNEAELSFLTGPPSCAPRARGPACTFPG